MLITINCNNYNQPLDTLTWYNNLCITFRLVQYPQGWENEFVNLCIPWGRIKWPQVVTRLTAHSMCGLVSAPMGCKQIIGHGHTWHLISLLRPVSLHNTNSNSILVSLEHGQLRELTDSHLLRVKPELQNNIFSTKLYLLNIAVSGCNGAWHFKNHRL